MTVSNKKESKVSKNRSKKSLIDLIKTRFNVDINKSKKYKKKKNKKNRKNG